MELLMLHIIEKKTLVGSSLTELINLCGGHVDFLKCDCEGGEWCVTKEELKNIRRIEMELHCIDNHTHEEYLNIFSDMKYCQIDKSFGRRHLHIQN